MIPINYTIAKMGRRPVSLVVVVVEPKQWNNVKHYNTIELSILRWIVVSGGSWRLIFMFGSIKTGPWTHNTPEPTFLPGFREKLKAVGHQRVVGHAAYLHSYAAQGRRGWSMPTSIIINVNHHHHQGTNHNYQSVIIQTRSDWARVCFETNRHTIMISDIIIMKIMAKLNPFLSSWKLQIKANKGKFGEEPLLVIRHSQSGLIGSLDQQSGGGDQNSNFHLSAFSRIRFEISESIKLTGEERDMN